MIRRARTHNDHVPRTGHGAATYNSWMQPGAPGVWFRGKEGIKVRVVRRIPSQGLLEVQVEGCAKYLKVDPHKVFIAISMEDRRGEERVYNDRR